jgi:hypothetical protein
MMKLLLLLLSIQANAGDGTVSNGDIHDSAGIVFRKMEALAASSVVFTDTNGKVVAGYLGGDVANSGSTVTIAPDAVTNAKSANMAQSTIKGRAAAAGTGDPTDLTATQATAILDAFTGDSGSGGVKGLVPAPASGDAAAGKFLKADGTWGATPAAGNYTYQTKTANYNILTSDNLLGASAASGSVVLILPAASGNSGLPIRVRREDNNPQYTVFLSAGSGQSVNEASSIALVVKDESITVVSDGSNWKTIERHIPSKWQAYTPVFTEFGAVATHALQWRRNGCNMEIRGRFTAAAVAASEARISLPFALNSDGTFITSNQNVGDYVRDFGSGTDTAHGGAMIINGTRSYMTFGSAGTFGAGNNNPLNNANSNAVLTGANDFLSMNASIPIRGWCD